MFFINYLYRQDNKRNDAKNDADNLGCRKRFLEYYQSDEQKKCYG